MKKKMYNRPVSDCMIIELNEVLMTSPGGGASAPPFYNGDTSNADWF